MKNTTTFYENQIAKGLCLDTVRQQEKIALAFENWCQLQQIKPKKASYNDVLEYVNHLQSIKNMPATIRSKMNTLAHYFDYLDVKINVARLIKLKGGIRTRMYLALETQELNAIFEAQKTHGITNKRNKVVLSLIVNQGLQRDDFERIECKDIDLENGTIHVPGSAMLNARVMSLAPSQILLFQHYLEQIRPEMLIEKDTNTGQFIVNFKGRTHDVKGLVFHILKPLKVQFPKLKNATQIRQSLISNWVKIHGLRQAQYMSGHKYVSSTERYNEDKMEGLLEEIKLFHPF